MPRAYVPILPGPEREDKAPWPADASRPLKKARRHTTVACNNCRLKKVSCDGSRPACVRCTKNKLSCSYVTKDADETPREALEREIATLQETLRQHEDVLQHLQSAPYREALSTVQRIRATPDAGSVLSSIRSTMVHKRPSSIRAARAVSPSTDSSIEFELMILNANAYPALEQLDTATVDPESFFQRIRVRPSAQPFTLSLQAEYDALTTTKEPDDAVVDGDRPGRVVASPPSPLRGTTGHRRSPLSGPPLERVYYDSRLNELNMEYWTSVPVSNEFAASLISRYLENEHEIIGAFDADAFIADLVGCRLGFCSSFLVSSLLALASQCYIGFDTRAFPLAVAFLAEAERLWAAERTSDSPSTLAALSMLSIVTMNDGNEALSMDLLADCRQMAVRMRLLDVPHGPHLLDEFRRLPSRNLWALSHVAWGTYSWLSTHASYYPQDPIQFPPMLPIPGEYDGQGSVELEWPPSPPSAHTSRVFAAWCKLWTISHEIQQVYNRLDGKSPLDTVPLEFVEAKYRRLLSWARDLTQDIARTGCHFSHALVLHAYYHIMILDLLRPFLQAPGEMRLKSFSSADASPTAIFNASFRQLQAIMVEYCQNHDPRLYHFFMNGAALHIFHIILHNTSSAGWQFYFKLCMLWMKQLFSRHAAIGKTAKGYMTIAMSTGLLSGAEASAYVESLQRRGRHYDLAEITVSCVIDFDRALASRDDGRAQELAQQFEELAFLDELITGDQEIESNSHENNLEG